MLREDDGPARVFVFCLATAFSDIGGYIAGVWKGKHPMAPSVSPKKSWEGFGGVGHRLCADGCVVGAVGPG